MAVALLLFRLPGGERQSPRAKWRAAVQLDDGRRGEPNNMTSGLARLGRKMLAGTAVLACLVLLLPSVSAQATQGARVSKEVEEKVRAAGPDDLLSVIVQTGSDPSQGHLARLHGRGGVVKTQHTSIHGYTARVPASQIEALAEDPEVEQVSYDSPVKAHMDVAYKAVRADAVYVASGGLLDGRGVGVALVDTGVQLHPDLMRPKGTPQVVEVEIVGHETGLADYYGHGTHVAGIINGNGYSSSDKLSYRTFKGIAPGALVISIRALSPDGTGYTSDIIAGIDWAVRNRSTYRIRVLNLSLGHPIYESYATDPLCRAVRAAYDAGIVVVVAAGNDGGVGSGFGTIDSPANEPSAVTVGAMDDSRTVTTTDDVLAWYSSRGPSLVDYVVKPDLVAPGTAIVSLRATGSYIDTTYHQFTLKLGDYKTDPKLALNDGVYYTLSGTSMAAPMVSGTAALMIQMDPTLNPATVKARLMKGAVKDDRLPFETGAGFLDVYGALAAGGFAKSALSPLAMLASDGNVYIQDTAVLWGDAVWSLGSIWGRGKSNADGIVMSDVSASILQTYGAIWNNRGGPKSLLDNNQVTASGAIWTGTRSILPSTTGMVDNLGAVWGPRKN